MSDAKPPPQVILTDLSNIQDRSISTKTNNRAASTRSIPIPLPGPFFSKKHLSVEVPRDQLTLTHNAHSHPENLAKRKTCPPNFIPNGFPWEKVPPMPSSSIGVEPPVEKEAETTTLTQSEKKSTNPNPSVLPVAPDGEISDLEEQFSELCVMYDSLFGFKDDNKKNPSQVNDSNQENKDSSFSSHHLSDEFSALETPSRLKKKKAVCFPCKRLT
jgi:hypothetical protein